jgi:hypothetical protein
VDAEVVLKKPLSARDLAAHRPRIASLAPAVATDTAAPARDTGPTRAAPTMCRHPLAFKEGNRAVSTITKTDGTQIHCKDWGQGQPVVLSNGCVLKTSRAGSVTQFHP